MGVAERRRSTAHVVTLVAIIPMAAVTIWLGSTSEHLLRPVAASLYWTYLFAASMAIGVYWWRCRPASRFGSLLVLFGVLVWVLSWQASSEPLAFNIGVLVEGPMFALTIYLFLAFPMGYIVPRAARWLMLVLVAGVLGFFVPWALFSPVIAGGGPLSGCLPNCPPNALQITTAPTVVEVAGKAETYVALAIVAAVLVVYGHRLLTASRPQRRALLAVAVTSLLFLPAYFVSNFAAWVLYVDVETVTTLQWVIVVTRVLLPLGFLIALLQADRFAATAQRTLLGQLASRPDPERWREAIAEAFDDPALRLGYREPSTGRFRGADGAPVEPPAERSGRKWVPVDREGVPVAAMVIDEALTADPELVQAAATATVIAVEHGALEGEVRASRSRIREAGDAERRRIQRDLHDSAQQRLIALRIHLAMLGEQLGREQDRAAVERLGDEIDQTLVELREVAWRTAPPLLVQAGVGPALAAVAKRAAIRVSVYDSGLGRHPETVETTIYFCCLESLQNAAKHAGADASVSIHLDQRDGHLTFAVEDDGAGFDPAAVQRGSGLTNLTLRVADVGGHLQIESAAGRGTRIAGEVPI